MSVPISISITPSSASITVDQVVEVSYNAGMVGYLAIDDSSFSGTAIVYSHTPETATSAGKIVLIGQAAGSKIIDDPWFVDTSGNYHDTDGSFQLTVTASTEDHEYLNKRGLFHLWRKIKVALANKVETSSVIPDSEIETLTETV